jgi:hypothetical protein
MNTVSDLKQKIASVEERLPTNNDDETKSSD